MKKRIILTLLTLCISLSITFAYANPVLIGGLEIPPSSPDKVPDKGGNAFIILKQFDNNCGPTSVQMVLHYYGIKKTIKDIQDAGQIETVAAGTHPDQISKALQTILQKERNVDVTQFSGYHAIPACDPYTTLKLCIDENRPPIILIRYGDINYHWVVVVGYADMGTPDESYLIADPGKTPVGEFKWYKKEDIDKKWSFAEHEALDLSIRNTLGSFQFDNFGGVVVSLLTDPYTMIVPKQAPDPAWHYPGDWSEMFGGVYEGLRTLNVLGYIVSNRTFQTKDFNPFYDYQISANKLLTSAQVAELIDDYRGSGIAENKVIFTIRATEGAFRPGKIWVVVRTYSQSPPPDLIVGFPDDESPYSHRG